MRLLGLVLLLLSLTASTAAAAGALPAEQPDGRALAAQLRDGTKSCGDLSAADLDHLGEAVMGQMLGSTAAHAAMDDRMATVLGAATATRMHEAMGARYADCTSGAAARIGAIAPNMGPGMMAGAGAGTAGSYGWMMNGGWRQMSPAAWHRVAASWTGVTGGGHHGTSAVTIASLVAALAALALAVGITLARRSSDPAPPGRD